MTTPPKKPPAPSAAAILRSHEEQLRAAGQFVTAARRAILRLLLSRRGHLSASAIATAVGRRGGASVATVYNNLTLFAELGIVRMVRAPHGEVCWDLRTDAHHHLLCQKCGAIEDVEGAAAEVVVARPLRRRVVGAEVWLLGSCDACAAAPA